MSLTQFIIITLSVLGVCLTIGGGIIGWVLSHGSRLRAAEVRIENLAMNAESDRRRSDAQFGQIAATLTRIEEIVAKKVDR